MKCEPKFRYIVVKYVKNAIMQEIHPGITQFKFNYISSENVRQ